MSSFSKDLSIPKSELDDLIKEEPVEPKDQNGLEFVFTGWDSPDRNLSRIFTKVDHKSLNMVECTICYKRMRESSMKQHCQTHSKVRRFECNICSQHFTRRSDMLRHQRVLHKKQKPHACKVCRKKFSTKSLLLSHLRNHVSSNVYECSGCRVKFCRKEYYDDHVKLLCKDACKTTATERMMIAEAQIKQITGQAFKSSHTVASTDSNDTDSIELVGEGEEVEQRAITVVEDIVKTDDCDDTEDVVAPCEEVQLHVSADDDASPVTIAAASFSSLDTGLHVAKKRKMIYSSLPHKDSSEKFYYENNFLSENSSILNGVTSEGNSYCNSSQNGHHAKALAHNNTTSISGRNPACNSKASAGSASAAPPHTAAHEATLTRLLESSATQARETLASLAASLGGEAGGGEGTRPASMGLTVRVGGQRRRFGVSVVGRTPAELTSGAGLKLLGEMVSAATGAPLEGRVCVALQPAPAQASRV